MTVGFIPLSCKLHNQCSCSGVLPTLLNKKLATAAATKSARTQTMNEIICKKAKTVNNNSKVIAINPIILFLRRIFSKDKLIFTGISVKLNLNINLSIKYV